jgi:hypothetical protein
MHDIERADDEDIVPLDPTAKPGKKKTASPKVCASIRALCIKYTRTNRALPTTSPSQYRVSHSYIQSTYSLKIIDVTVLHTNRHAKQH